MIKIPEICPVCEKVELKEKKITRECEYKGEVLEIPEYVVHDCKVCKESIVDPNTLKRASKKLRDFHRKVDGLLQSNEIKRIREESGYTQECLEDLLGVGPKTFTRYENNVVTQSRIMDLVLRILRIAPEVIDLAKVHYTDTYKVSSILNLRKDTSWDYNQQEESQDSVSEAEGV